MAQALKNEYDSKKKTINRRFRKSFGAKDRSATDKYWCLLFIFAFIVWILSCYHAFYYDQHRVPEFKLNSDDNDGTDMNNVSTITSLYLQNRSVLFDMITCNLASLNEHNPKSIPFAMYVNVNLGIILIWYSLSSMRKDNMFNYQMSIVGFHISFISIYRRILLWSLSSDSNLIAPYHEQLLFWLVPEAIFLIVCYTKTAHNDDHLLSHCDEINYFDGFTWSQFLFVFIPLSFYLILFKYTAYIAYELDWNSTLFYVIVGGSCYIGLTLFYFWLIVVACAVDMEMDYKRDDLLHLFSLSTLVSAIKIVSRYHFGTACYHATLIFPRLESLLVMNEPEFMKDEQLYFISRLYTVQCKLHNLTMMSTAVGGTNHLESLKELIRYHQANTSKEFPKLQYFQGYSKIARSVAALLLSTNNLQLVLLWAHGMDTSSFSLSTWAFYIRFIISLTITTKVSDTISDTTLLHEELVPYDDHDIAAFLHHADGEHDYIGNEFTQGKYESHKGD